MSEDDSDRKNTSTTESELYFLITKFLACGPCKNSADVLRREIEQHGLFSTRFDWKGNKHRQSFQNLDASNGHIKGDHMLKICERIGFLLDKEIKPRVTGVKSLLGGARQSLLRTAAHLKPPLWAPSVHTAIVNHRPLAPPNKLAHVPNAYNVIRGRTMSGVARWDHLMPAERYGKNSLHLRTLGHLSSVYCVAFDRTGRRIFTGADDHLVKIWSCEEGRILATLRGHSAEIVDMNVNYENTLLAAASNDKVIRVWNLQSLAPVAVLMGHTAMITSLEFSPFNRGSNRYMATTGADGCICIWMWNKGTLAFNNKPIKFQERSRPGSQMLCLSFSPGGTFLVAGSTDTLIRVYNFNTMPEKVAELETHTDRVDSIDFCHSGSRFISGSKDGTARVWRYERQEWKSLLLNMSTRLPGSKAPGLDEGNKIMKHRVTMVGWDQDDKYVVTAVNDHSLRVWNSYNGKLVHELYGHTDEVYVLEGHPKDSRIFLSGGHDGLIFLWDLTTGYQLYRFFNTIEGQGYGSIYDCKFSPNGEYFVGTDSHGHVSIFGFGSSKLYDRVPTEQFFHTDYRPLVRDANNYVLDEQTQQAPHLMPPPFLVDIDGNPHPPRYQRLVPGRENSNDSALIPQIGVAENGVNEVIGDQEMQAVEVEPLDEANQAASILDEMIHRMQQEQDEDRDPALNHEGPHTPGRDRSANGPLSPSLSPRGLRRAGEIEGVRLATGNVPVSQQASQADLLAFKSRVVVPELPAAIARFQEDYRRRLDEEAAGRFKVEKKKRPLPPPMERTESGDSLDRPRRRKKNRVNHNYRTRSTQEGIPPGERRRGDTDEEDELRDERGEDTLSDMDERVEQGAISGAETSEEEGQEWHSTSENESESSEYSDWTADAGINLQPPKRRSQSRKKKLPWESDEEAGSSEQKTETPPVKSKRKRRPPKALAEDDEDDQPLPDLPEEMKPTSWITDTVPRRCPYVPQMGDEVIYLRQGHEAYVAAVKKRKVYHIELRKQHWTKLNLKDQELVKVVGIKYQVGPPALCGLKLAFIDPDIRRPTGGHFSIKYHDMPDVIDFLVLRQHFDQSVAQKWKTGDRFRSMIDDAWWLGTIVAHNPLEAEHPDSLFQCFLVDWDNGECERMSPWDLEPIDKHNVPEERGGSIPVQVEELLRMLYVPDEGEWGATDRDTFCDRILKCLQQTMSLRIAEQFNTPVDLNDYPSYAYTVPYPTDLSTIMRRLEKRFYRRIAALQWEVRKIEQNALEFNERESIIVRWAETVTKILMEVVKDDHCDDAIAVYNRISEDSNDHVRVTDSSSGNEDKPGPSSRTKRRKDSIQAKKTKRPNKACYDPKAWLKECKQLVQNMWECQDSVPFRFPVDENHYTDYRNIIDMPMDLTTVREQLDGGSYLDPMDLGKDIRLIFTNSKNYTPNKKSRIYGMTLRLSALFEDCFRGILSNYRSAIKYEKQVKSGLRRKRILSSPGGPSTSSGTLSSSSYKRKSKKAAKVEHDDDNTDVDAPGPSGIQQRLSRSSSKRKKDNVNSDEDEEDEDGEKPGPSGTRSIDRNSSNLTDQLDNDAMEEIEEDTKERAKRSKVRTRLKQSDSETSRTESQNGTGEGKKAAKKVEKEEVKVVVKEDEKVDDEDEDDSEDGEEEQKEEEEEDEDDTEEEEEDEEEAEEAEEEEAEEEEEEEVKEVRNTRSKSKRELTNGYKKNQYSKQKDRLASENSEESQGEEEEEKKKNEDDGEDSEHSNYEAETDVDSDEESNSSSDNSDTESYSSDAKTSYRTRTQTRRKSTRNVSRKREKSSKGTKRKAKSKHSPRKTQKRSRRNDYSDDDDTYTPSHRQSSKTDMRTRNQGRQMQYYGDYDDSDNQSGDEGVSRSVSSRGRVRKLTPRARASLLGV